VFLISKYSVFFAAYFTSLPLIWAYTLLSGRITLSILFSIVLLTTILCNIASVSRKIEKRYVRIMSFYGVFSLCALLSALFSDNYNVSSFLHLISYLSAPLFFYLVPLIFGKLYLPGRAGHIALSMCYYLGIILAAFLVVELLASNFLDVDFHSYLFLPRNDLPESRFLGVYVRARGFAPEPGHSSLLLEVLIFLGMAHLAICHASAVKKAAYFCFCYVGVIATASVAGVVLIPSVYILASLAHAAIYSTFKKVSKVLITVGMGLSVLYGVYYSGQAKLYNDFIDNQIIEKYYSYSASDRLDRIDVFLSLISQYNIGQLIFGAGSGIVTKYSLGESETILSLYLLVMLELGVLGFAFLLIFIIYSFVSLSRVRKVGESYLLAGLIVTFLHYILIANYWYPYLWLCPLVVLLLGSGRQLHQRRLTLQTS